MRRWSTPSISHSPSVSLSPSCSLSASASASVEDEGAIVRKAVIAIRRARALWWLRQRTPWLRRRQQRKLEAMLKKAGCL